VSALIRAEGQRLEVSERMLTDPQIVERCMLALINEGARLLESGIAASAADIDVIWCNGYGFPRRLGGPMFHADQLGLVHVVQAIGRLAREPGGAYWQPAALIGQLASAGGRLAEWRSSSVS
jgi:3-hydroxyacyl-CoA dehydrogenase